MRMQQYVEHLQKYGELSFTLQQAIEALKKPRYNILNEIHRLKKKGILISPLKGFYIIIPLEHRDLGSLPAEDLIVLSMEYLGIPYYAGLLTAAAYYGATHQRLRVFQIISSKRLSKNWIFGDVKIEFIYKKDISHVELVNRKTTLGYLPISTPEETAKDVMTYYKQSGGLNHQATVLSELTTAIDEKTLVSLAKSSEGLFWIQRMGYILEHIDTFYEKDRDKLVKALEDFIKTQNIRYIPLAPELGIKDKPRNKKWKIIENTTVESDI